jgi:hypothetical protein
VYCNEPLWKGVLRPLFVERGWTSQDDGSVSTTSIDALHSLIAEVNLSALFQQVGAQLMWKCILRKIMM